MMIVRGILAAAVLSLAVPAASAGDFPDQPVRLVVPFSAGGPTDTAARLIAEPMRRQLGQTIVIENRPGAGGVPATEAVVQGPHDGYTLVVGGIAPIVLIPAVKPLRYDVEKDLAPLGLIWRTPQVLAVRSSLKVDTVADLIKYAKEHPGKLNIGSAGIGTVTHLAGELFKREVGITAVHVPYRSTSNSVVDLVSGQIDVIFGDIATLAPHIHAGSIKALAITSPERSSLAPELKTMAEVGFPNVQTEVWFGLFAPARTPPAALDKLKTAVLNAQNDPEYLKGLEKYGIRLNGSGADSFAAFVSKERERWTPILKELGIKF